ncbi:MAG: hypothetical protein QN198_02880 [Armatimonadota bacterium]|nr:hypothetical protein [Armatimonadota bacterium]MDR5702528.1 hypothetical protein [Armatimonadota bacterium]
MKISGIEDLFGRATVEGLRPHLVPQQPSEQSFGTILRQAESVVEATSNHQEASASLPPLDEERMALSPLQQVQFPAPIESASALERPQTVAASNTPAAPSPQGSTASPPRTLVDFFRGMITAFRQARAQGKNFLAAVLDTIKYLFSLIKLSGPPAASSPPPSRINERA